MLILMYGSACWANRARVKKNQRKLLQAQRAALLAATRAYNTVSHEALRVIAGTPPIDLVIEERALISADKRNGIPGTKAIRRSETLDKWQDRWDATQNGQITKIYLPNVAQRINQGPAHRLLYHANINRTW